MMSTSAALQLFWRLEEGHFQPEDWLVAIGSARECLAGLPAAAGTPLEDLAESVLHERQFGPDHWRLSFAKRVYYQYARPLMPAFLRVPLRTLLLSRQGRKAALGWPIERRYVDFVFEVVRRLLELKGLAGIPYVRFWPGGKDFAFVITHDVERREGLDFVPRVAELEEAYGFRSSFNIVPEGYRVDPAVLEGLRERGFEVGVHGLRHDGRLYSSRAAFREQSAGINGYLQRWGAVGFRSPFTHRHPDWMQDLEIEYDLSFFDTDPFEPMPGGTMSIWPFRMGRFVELPYTLVQDHTMMVTLRETTPRLWLEKMAYLRLHQGMALVNAHPDYLREPHHLAIYEAFLRAMKETTDAWHALPREVARWWRVREAVVLHRGRGGPEASTGLGHQVQIGQVRLSEAGQLRFEAEDARSQPG